MCYGGPNGKTFFMPFIQVAGEPPKTGKEFKSVHSISGLVHYKRINYCPFCGKELKLALVEKKK
jgi:hypothetical protein